MFSCEFRDLICLSVSLSVGRSEISISLTFSCDMSTRVHTGYKLGGRGGGERNTIIIMALFKTIKWSRPTEYRYVMGIITSLARPMIEVQVIAGN